MLAILGNGVLDVLGELSLAMAIGWLGWHAGRCLHFPEFGPPAGVAVLALVQHLAHRPLLQLTMYFLVIIAIGLLPTGRDWRKRERLYRLFNLHASGKPIQTMAKTSRPGRSGSTQRPFPSRRKATHHPWWR